MTKGCRDRPEGRRNVTRVRVLDGGVFDTTMKRSHRICAGGPSA